MLLRNHWYVAAWSEDVGRTPLGRVLLNEYVVLFRGLDGTVVALENRCAHRNLPLSEGRLIGDEVECSYHGLVFGRDGVCTHVPGQEDVPGWARVKSYPVAERNRWVFVWMGDPDKADPGLVPGYHAKLADPDWSAVTGQARVRGGYRLVLDNLLDLSHLTYVHSSTTGNRALAEEATLIVEDGDDFVRVTRWMEGIAPAPAFVQYAGDDGPIDRWQVSKYIPPSYIDICNGSAAAGEGLPQEERPFSQGRWGFVVYHALTPETETATHQFWALAIHRSMVPTDKEALFTEQMQGVPAEDLAVYEAQQRAIDLDPEMKGEDVNPRGTIPADDALLRMRRMIRRLHGEEQRA
ncbi:MAG: aromatic ring-hydroxylating dioxygenase subunit alpha [Defluviicoccus sp.]|nr:aromatic ring-hydroxylating dioxygenase subunit alpha [Defluviicoccus sp.]